MAVISTWLCGHCVAQDVLFAARVDDAHVFTYCAACSAVRLWPPAVDGEFIEMDGILGEVVGGDWRFATLSETEKAGYASRVDQVLPDFYESLVARFRGFKAPQ